MKNIVVFVVLVLAIPFWYYTQHPLTSSITIRGHKIFVELAVTPEEKQKGLGYRNSLPKDHGMLFLMGEPAYHGFWMKNMHFPLDFIWIDGATVVDLSENIPYPVANQQPMSLRPRTPADKVLEVNAGTVKESGIQVGDTIRYNR